jgi:hypothetical protein
MSTTLERRMAKLEEATSPNANRIDVIFRRIVSPRGNGEMVRAKLGDRVLERGADETESIFMERAKVAALAATAQRPCRVILLPEEALT